MHHVLFEFTEVLINHQQILMADLVVRLAHLIF